MGWSEVTSTPRLRKVGKSQRGILNAATELAGLKEAWAFTGDQVLPLCMLGLQAC